MPAYPVMPPLPISMASGLKKTPVFNTNKQKTAAGVTYGFAKMPYPTWQFELSLDNIVGRETHGIVSVFFGVYMATQGGANNFLFSDQQDNAVTNMQFGVGDGASTAFQLSRYIYNSVDVIQNVKGTPAIFINGTLTAPASISSTGVVSFSSAPADGAILTWSGGFYYLCRFSEDSVDSTRTYTVNDGIDQWMISGIKFASEFAFTTSYGVIAGPLGG